MYFIDRLTAIHHFKSLDLV